MAKKENGFSFRWALPPSLDVPADKLRVRLDFYSSAAVLHFVEDDGTITTRTVAPREVVLALLRSVPLHSGLLPRHALWWAQTSEGTTVALWRPPQVWPVALQVEPFQPPRRFKLPMPGLIFVCRAGSPPTIYAAKKRPARLDDLLYYAPLYNVFDNGRSCAGTHHYPDEVERIPESFFMAFFTRAGVSQPRSKKYGTKLFELWEAIDGKARYPVSDLVTMGKISEVLR